MARISTPPQRRRRLAAIVALAGALRAPAPAWAQTTRDLAAAKQAFKEGDEAEGRGDYPTALARFGQALSVKETAQLHLRIGAIEEKLGRLQDALASYQRGLDKASTPVVARVAKEQIDALAPRIPTVTLIFPRPLAGLAVTLDDAPVAPSALGTPLRVDPGAHRLHVTAPGYQPRDQAFTSAERGGVRVELDLLAAGPSSGAATGGSALPGALVLGGGGAALVAGLALLAASYVKDGTINAQCKGPDRLSCPASQKPVIDGEVAAVDAMRFASLGVMAVGVAGAAVGGYLLVRASRPSATGHVRVLPLLGAGVAGLTATGAF